MIITQLNEPIPINVVESRAWRGPHGAALAYAWIDYGIDHDMHWRVCFDDGGAFWDVPNPFVRGVENITAGRVER
jgi:hypothetical protein